jgi:hypothetical protein
MAGRNGNPLAVAIGFYNGVSRVSDVVRSAFEAEIAGQSSAEFEGLIAKDSGHGANCLPQHLTVSHTKDRLQDVIPPIPRARRSPLHSCVLQEDKLT